LGSNRLQKSSVSTLADRLELFAHSMWRSRTVMRVGACRCGGMAAALPHGMRSPVVIAVLWSATALAGPEAPAPAPTPAPPSQAPGATAPTPTPVPVSLTKVDVEALPEACRDIGKQADSPIKARALSARISLASCLVDEKTKPLVLCDCEQSVNEINDAIDPSLIILDEVVLVGDPATKILARHSQGEILSGFAQRMLSTVPPPVNASEEAIALRNTRLDLLQPLIQPWLSRAQVAFSELDKIARANPQLAKNPAVAAAVRASRAKLGATQSAKR
jgi:hypothetical protein